MDRGLRLQILRAIVRDKAFLKQVSYAIQADYFEEREEELVAKAALEFYAKYNQPIGALLRAKVDTIIERGKLKEGIRDKIKRLVRDIFGADEEAVSVQALADHCKELKKKSFYSAAVEKIIDHYEQGNLGRQQLREIIEDANKKLKLDDKIESIDYLSEKQFNKRQERRSRDSDDDYPSLYITPLDRQIRIATKGHLAIWIAPPSGGKGLALVHTTSAYAKQGLKVLHLTLEDPLELVEDRLDASLTGISLKRLKHLPNRLRRKFRRIRQTMSGRIRIVDGTDDSWSVPRIRQLVDQLKVENFYVDAIVIDYDDEIECDRQFKGDSARRMEFAHIYRQLRRLAADTDTIVWTAAQTTRGAEGRKIITSKDTAEDFSKIRKVFLAITIGSDTDNVKSGKQKYLYVAKNRSGRSRFGVHIMSDYNSALFYDPDTKPILKKKEEDDKKK